MGNLVDTFLIRIKDKWKDIVSYPNEEQVMMILAEIPAKYHEMYKGLLKGDFSQMDEIMDTTWEGRSWEVEKIADGFNDPAKEVYFDVRYRTQCLKSILRKKFYDTISIIEDDFDPSKRNRYITVAGCAKLINENDLNEMSGDQKFTHQACKSFVENKGGTSTVIGDGTVYKDDTTKH